MPVLNCLWMEMSVWMLYVSLTVYWLDVEQNQLTATNHNKEMAVECIFLGY